MVKQLLGFLVVAVLVCSVCCRLFDRDGERRSSSSSSSSLREHKRSLLSHDDPSSSSLRDREHHKRSRSLLSNDLSSSPLDHSSTRRRKSSLDMDNDISPRRERDSLLSDPSERKERRERRERRREREVNSVPLTQMPEPGATVLFGSDGFLKEEIPGPKFVEQNLIYAWPFSLFRMSLRNHPDWSSFLTKFQTFFQDLTTKEEYTRWWEKRIKHAHDQRDKFGNVIYNRNNPERYTEGAFQERTYFHRYQQEVPFMKEMRPPLLEEYYGRLNHTFKDIMTHFVDDENLRPEDVEMDYWTSFGLFRKDGGHHALHIHGPEDKVSWVAVLYVQVPPEQESINRLWASNAKTLFREHEEVAIHAKQGDLVIHPSWLTHGTQEVQWKSMRGLLASNLMMNCSKKLLGYINPSPFFDKYNLERYSVLGSYIYFSRSMRRVGSLNDFISQTRDMSGIAPLHDHGVSNVIMNIQAEYLRRMIDHKLRQRKRTQRPESQGECENRFEEIRRDINVDLYAVFSHWNPTSNDMHHLYPSHQGRRVSSEELNTTSQIFHSMIFHLSETCPKDSVIFGFIDETQDMNFPIATSIDRVINSLGPFAIKASGGDTLIFPASLAVRRFQFSIVKPCQVGYFYVSNPSPFDYSCSLV